MKRELLPRCTKENNKKFHDFNNHFCDIFKSKVICLNLAAQGVKQISNSNKKL